MRNFLLVLLYLLMSMPGISSNLDYMDFNCASGSAGRLWFPLFGPGQKTRRMPLVLMAHGNGYSVGDYYFLVEALVDEGFVVACVGAQEDSGIQERVEGMMADLDSVFGSYPKSLNGDVVLLGHSRGGEAVISAANRLLNSGYMVRAVISMAPSFEDPLQALSSQATQNLLVLYGSHDGDVDGIFSSEAPMESPFGIYDSAFPNPGPLNKKLMLYLHGGSHSGFSDDEETRDLPEPPQGLLSTYQQRLFTQGTVIAFLRWSMYGDPISENFLLNNANRKDWNIFQSHVARFPHGFNPSFSTLYSKAPVLALDDFEDQQSSFNQTGGKVWASEGAGIEQNYHYLLDGHSPHLGKGLLVRWDKTLEQVPGVSFEINEPYRNLSKASHLVFKVSQRYGDPKNVSATTKDFKVKLTESSGKSATGHLSDWASLAYAVTCYSPEQKDTTKSAMITVRIPMYVFQGLNLADISKLELIFDVLDSDGGCVILDDVAFFNL